MKSATKLLIYGIFLQIPFQSLAFSDVTILNKYSLSKINNGPENPENILRIPNEEWNSVIYSNNETEIFSGKFTLSGRFLATLNKTSNLGKVAINEAYYSHFNDAYLVSIGRKKVKWGVGYVSSPTDIISPAPLATDATDDLFSIAGSDLGQLSIFGTNNQFDIYYLPLTKNNKKMLTSEAVAFRWYRYVEPFDFGVIARIEKNNLYSIGINNAITIGENLELHSEYLYQSQNINVYPQSNSIDLQKRSESLSRSLLGGQWSANKNLNFLLEYFHYTEGFSENDWVNYQQTLTNINALLNDPATKETAINMLKILEEQNQSLKRKNYLFSRIFQIECVPNSDFEWIILVGLDDKSSLHRLTLNYKFSKSNEVYIRGSLTTGVEKSEFNQNFPENSFQLGNKYVF